MKKAQESAPIELLIGVVILTFVLIIGMNSYQNLCSTQYEQKLKASISNLANNLELIYKGSAGSSVKVTVDLTPPPACGYNVKDVRILKGSPEMCKQHLGRDSCLAIIATSQEKGQVVGVAATELVNIPSDVAVSLDLGGTICSSSLNSIAWSYWSDTTNYNNCWLSKSYYTLTLSKTTSGISITSSS